MKTSVLIDHEPVADGGFLVRALLRIEGDVPAQKDRVPLNLSLVLDRSGSMGGGKLDAAKEAAALLVRRLHPEDTVSVVAYDSAVTVVAPPATGDAQADLPDRVEAITTGGTTNLSGGWLRGRDLVSDGLRTGGVNRVILLTDGQANVGITDPDRLVGLAQGGARAGITTTTLGFGRDYDEDLLRAMADAGRGGTYFIETVDQAAGIFEEELEGLLSLAAQNVRVRIEPGADAEAVKVLHQVPSHAEGDVLVLEVGDLYGREPRSILLETLLRPESSRPGAQAEIAHLTVTAHVLTEDGGVELRTITLPLTLTPEEGGAVEPTVRKEILLVEAARAREEALRLRERGDFEAAYQRLQRSAGSIRDSGILDEDLAEESRDLTASAARFEGQSVDAADVKYLKQRAYSTDRGRRQSLERYRRDEPDRG